MMMLGGSPHMVAEPPRLAQKTSARMAGTGSNFRSCPSSMVTVERKRMTVMLSMNMERAAESSMKVRKIGKGR